MGILSGNLVVRLLISSAVINLCLFKNIDKHNVRGSMQNIVKAMESSKNEENSSNQCLFEIFERNLVEPTKDLTGLEESELVSKDDIRNVYGNVVRLLSERKSIENFDNINRKNLELNIKILSYIINEIDYINTNSDISSISKYIKKYNNVLGILQKRRDELINSEKDSILQINKDTVSLIDRLKGIYSSLYCYLRYSKVMQNECVYYDRFLIDCLIKVVNYSKSWILSLEKIAEAISAKFLFNSSKGLNDFFDFELVEPTQYSTNLQKEDLVPKYKVIEACSDFKHQLDISPFKDNGIELKFIKDMEFISGLDADDFSGLLGVYKKKYNGALKILRKSLECLSAYEKDCIEIIYTENSSALQILEEFYSNLEYDIEKIGKSIFTFSSRHGWWIQFCKMLKTYTKGWILTLQKIEDIISGKFNFVKGRKFEGNFLKGEMLSKGNGLLDSISYVENENVENNNISDEIQDKCIGSKNEVNYSKNVVYEDDYYNYYHYYITSREVNCGGILDPYEDNKNDMVLKIVDFDVASHPTVTINLSKFFDYDLLQLIEILMSFINKKSVSAERVRFIYDDCFKETHELVLEYVKSGSSNNCEPNKKNLECFKILKRIANFEVDSKLPGAIVTRYKEKYDNMRDILRKEPKGNVNYGDKEKIKIIEDVYNLTVVLEDVLRNVCEKLDKTDFGVLYVVDFADGVDEVKNYLESLRRALRVVAAVIIHKFPFVEEQKDKKYINVLKEKLIADMLRIDNSEVELDYCNTKNVNIENLNSAYKKEIVGLGENSKEAYKNFRKDYKDFMKLLDSDFKNCSDIYLGRNDGIFKEFAKKIDLHIEKVKNYTSSCVNEYKNSNNVKYDEMSSCYGEYVESLCELRDFALKIFSESSNLTVDIFRQNFKDMLEMKNFKESLAIREKLGHLVKTTAEGLISGKDNLYGCNFFESKNIKEFFSVIATGECIGGRDEVGNFSTFNSFSYGYKLKRDVINILKHINSGELEKYLEVTYFNELKNKSLERFINKTKNLKYFVGLKGVLENRIKTLNKKLCDMFCKYVTVNISKILRICVEKLHNCLKFDFKRDMKALHIPLNSSRCLFRVGEFEKKFKKIRKTFFDIEKLGSYYVDYENEINNIKHGWDELFYNSKGEYKYRCDDGREIVVDGYVHDFVIPLLDYLCILDECGLKELGDMLACQFKFMLYSSYDNCLDKSAPLLAAGVLVGSCRDMLENSFNKLKLECENFKDMPENEPNIYQRIGRHFLYKLVRNMLNTCEEYIKIYKTPSAISKSEYNINSGLKDCLESGLRDFVKNATSNLKIKDCKIEDLLLKDDGVLFGHMFSLDVYATYIYDFLNAILGFVNIYCGNFEQQLGKIYSI